MEQLKYGPETETFNKFVKQLMITDKQVDRKKRNAFISAFLFGKLPIQIQQELSMVG